MTTATVVVAATVVIASGTTAYTTESMALSNAPATRGGLPRRFNESRDRQAKSYRTNRTSLVNPQVRRVSATGPAGLTGSKAAVVGR